VSFLPAEFLEDLQEAFLKAEFLQAMATGGFSFSAGKKSCRNQVAPSLSDCVAVRFSGFCKIFRTFVNFLTKHKYDNSQ
jgi:hypothetical protein